MAKKTPLEADMARLQKKVAEQRTAAETTEGTINFHEWLGTGWGILFSHPKDFTPVCTTELGYMAKIKGEFDKRGVKILAISVDGLESHRGWTKDITLRLTNASSPRGLICP